MSRERLGANYWKLWIASAISNLGDGVRWTALPLLAASLTHDPARVAAIDFSASLPWFLFALPAGALVDRLDRRRVMVVSNVVRAAAMSLLAFFVLRELAPLFLLYAIAFCLGCAETMFDNAAQALMPRLVERAHLEKANGRLYAAELIANQFVGPPLGGFLFAIAMAVPFLLDAASFAIAAGLIVSLVGAFRVADRPDAVTKLRHDIGEGLRWLWAHRLLRTLAAFLGIQNMMSTACFSIFVLVSIEILGLSDAGYGLLLTSLAIGSFVGSVTVSPLSRKVGSGTTLFICLAVSAAAYLVVALSSNPVVTGIGIGVLGWPIVAWNVITVSLRQSIIPDRLLGRVNSVYRLMGWGTMPLGAALGGLLGRTLGLRSPFFVAAAAHALLAVVAIAAMSNAVLSRAREEAADPPA
ncbi:MAG TPA: MFS transporter [Actinomycetota bacterium]|nr:MFS transporter [Actinomycetota bacterium]